jgi:hypothetical protein
MQDRCRASRQPLESIDDRARGGRVTRLGQLIPQLGYLSKNGSTSLGKSSMGISLAEGA